MMKMKYLTIAIFFAICKASCLVESEKTAGPPSDFDIFSNKAEIEELGAGIY